MECGLFVLQKNLYGLQCGPAESFNFNFWLFLRFFASASAAGGIFSSFDGGKRDSFEKRRRALAATTAVAVTLKNKKSHKDPDCFLHGNSTISSIFHPTSTPWMPVF